MFLTRVCFVCLSTYHVYKILDSYWKDAGKPSLVLCCLNSEEKSGG